MGRCVVSNRTNVHKMASLVHTLFCILASVLFGAIARESSSQHYSEKAQVLIQFVAFTIMLVALKGVGSSKTRRPGSDHRLF